MIPKRKIRQYIRRYEELIRVLRALTPKQRATLFTMWTWGRQRRNGDIAACAAGWAGMDPWFRRRGFKLVKAISSLHDYVPEYRGKKGMDACLAFFGTPSGGPLEPHPVFAGDAVTVRSVIREVRMQIKELQSLL